MIEEPTFVGIDLAWKTTNRTGLAVVGEDGRLIDSTSVSHDSDIEAWVLTQASNAIVVAVDAPLIVPNESGQRIAEKLIGQAYGKYGASAHTSNRTNPLFTPSRAQSLAQRLGWSIDPNTRTGTGSTVCIEVYPHPALVGLFKLPYRILYKKGPDRQAGFRQLAAQLASVWELKVHESPRWDHLMATIADPRPGDLNRVEDELDAIICAHLAWLWHHHRQLLHVYGDVDDGYIVAPPPPTHNAVRPSKQATSRGEALPPFDERMQSPEMRYAYQVIFSTRMISEIAARYSAAQDGNDTLLPYAMLDSFYMHIRLLSEFLTKCTSDLDFGPADFGVASWSAPEDEATSRLVEYRDVASKYVVHYGRPRVPPSIDELVGFDVSAAAFQTMATDVLAVLETFVACVEASVDAGAELTPQRLRAGSLREALELAKSRLADLGSG